MSFRNLRDFLRALEREGDLKRIAAPVSSELEITEIAWRGIKQGGPALLFENVAGSRFPLAINIFGTDRRVERALGRHPEEIGASFTRAAHALQPPSPAAVWRERGTFRKALAMRPPALRRGPSQEVVEEPDLDALPILKCWPGDGGPFITWPLVLTRSPVSGRRNLGTYRIHKFDQRTTGIHWQIMKGGEMGINTTPSRESHAAFSRAELDSGVSRTHSTSRRRSLSMASAARAMSVSASPCRTRDSVVTLHGSTTMAS